MQCDKVRERLQDYIEGLVTTGEGASIRLHLQSCTKCGAIHSELIKTIGLIKGLDEVEPPSWLKQKVMARVKEEASRQSIWKRLFYPLHIKLPLEAAATVLIAVAAVYILKTTQQEMKVAEVGPEVLSEQQPRMKDDISQKGSATKETEKTIAPLATPKKTAPKSVPSADTKAEIRQLYDATDLPQLSPQEAPSQRSIAPPPPSPAGQIDKMDSAADRREMKALDAAKAKESMGSGVYPEKKVLREMPAAPSVIMKDEMAASEKDLISIKDSTIHLNVTDIGKARTEIEKSLSGLGGRIVGTETIKDKTVLTAEIEPMKIKAFFEKLGTLGELKEKEPPSSTGDGKMRLKIEMLKTSGH